MTKPDKLRELLSQTIPLFLRNPDRLQLYYANGNLHTTGANSLSFQYAYDLEIIVTDFPLHPDVLFVPILAFIAREQSELLFNPNFQEKITFEIEPNNNKTYDIFIKIPLTERVIVKSEGESYTAQHAEEPQPKEWQLLDKITVFVQGEKVWESELKKTEKAE
jgi:hypothetical protein